MGVVASLSRSERAFWSSMMQVMMGEANDTLRMFRLLRSVTHAEMYILSISCCSNRGKSELTSILAESRS